MRRKEIKVFNLRFFSGSMKEGLEELIEGGLAVFPAAPALAYDFNRCEEYRKALETADLTFADSGAMVLFWRFLTGAKIPRYSGLRVLAEVLKRSEVRIMGATFWVMPSEEEMLWNRRWLNGRGIPVEEAGCYCAPRYGSGVIVDQALVDRIEEMRPQLVIICIGGGVQERLGLSLRDALSYRPAILCTGAAIGFLTGSQAIIPTWGDRMMLGWLFRCLKNPRVFVPRYLRALSLFRMLFVHWLTGRDPSYIGNKNNEVSENW